MEKLKKNKLKDPFENTLRQSWDDVIPSLFFSILNWKMGLGPDKYFSKSPPQLTENTVVEFSMYPSLLSSCVY